MISHKTAWIAASLLAALVCGGPILANPSGPAGPAPGEADRLFARMLERSRQVRDFRARFNQRLFSRGLAVPAEESGEVLYLRPGKMRWDYEEPEKKLALSDGKNGWLYLPEENRAIRMDLTASVGVGPLADLLAGNEQALPAFRASRLPDDPGLVGLRLVPLVPREEFDAIELRADATSLRLKQIDVVDPGGNRMTFRFSEMTENTGLPESLFAFAPPPGTRIEEP